MDLIFITTMLSCRASILLKVQSKYSKRPICCSGYGSNAKYVSSPVESNIYPVCPTSVRDWHSSQTLPHFPGKAADFYAKQAYRSEQLNTCLSSSRSGLEVIFRLGWFHMVFFTQVSPTFTMAEPRCTHRKQLSRRSLIFFFLKVSRRIPVME